MKHTATLKLSTTGDATVTTITACNIAAALEKAGYPVAIKEHGKRVAVPLPTQVSAQGNVIIEITPTGGDAE